MKKKLAIKINSLMLEFGAKLDTSIVEVQEQCSDREFIEYKNAIGKILGFMLIDVMNPIYRKHPDLKPDKLDGSEQK